MWETLDTFITSNYFPFASSLFLSAWALIALFFAAPSRRMRVLIAYLREVATGFRSNDRAGSGERLTTAKAQKKLGLFGAQLSAAYRIYQGQLEFDSATNTHRAVTPAESIIADRLIFDHHLSQVADQIVRTALLLTFFGIAYGLFKSVALISGGTDLTETVKGIKDLLATASAKFFISACGLFWAIILRIFDTRLQRAHAREVSALCVEIDACFLAEQRLLTPELEAATHLIESVGQRFDEINGSIANLVQGFGTVSKQVERWHEIATKITGERYRYELGFDPQSLVQGSMRSIEEALLDQFWKTTLLHRAQQEAVEGFSQSIAGLSSAIQDLTARVERAGAKANAPRPAPAPGPAKPKTGGS